MSVCNLILLKILPANSALSLALRYIRFGAGLESDVIIEVSFHKTIL